MTRSFVVLSAIQEMFTEFCLC